MRGAVLTSSLACLLAGCASFEGMPRPVVTSDEAALVARKFMPDQVEDAMSGLGGAERTTYRNRVVSSYLMALDARYDDFRRELSRNFKGGEVGFDTTILGLTGLASVLTSGTQELAAAATALGGTRASLNRQLYAEKTLPVVIALMDARRMTVRAEIMRHSSEPENVYTIQEAFSDIWRYQSAADIDAAIQLASAAAAQEAAKAKYDYTKAVELCSVDDQTVSQGRRAIMYALEDLADAVPSSDAAVAGPARTKLQAAVIATGQSGAQQATTQEDAEKQLVLVRDKLDLVCTAASLNAFKGKLTTAGVM